MPTKIERILYIGPKRNRKWIEKKQTQATTTTQQTFFAYQMNWKNMQALFSVYVLYYVVCLRLYCWMLAFGSGRWVSFPLFLCRRSLVLSPLFPATRRFIHHIIYDGPSSSSSQSQVAPNGSAEHIRTTLQKIFAFYTSILAGGPSPFLSPKVVDPARWAGISFL